MSTRRAHAVSPSGRGCTAAVLALALAGCAWWRNVDPPEWSARETTDRPGVLEIEADRDWGGSFAQILTLDGRTALVACESVPCRAVVPPGRYRLVVGTGSIAWVEAFGADVEVEVAPCVTERLRVALASKLLPGKGRILRREQVPLASDPHRWRKAPLGCVGAPERPRPSPAAAPGAR